MYQSIQSDHYLINFTCNYFQNLIKVRTIKLIKYINNFKIQLLAFMLLPSKIDAIFELSDTKKKKCCIV